MPNLTVNDVTIQPQVFTEGSWVLDASIPMVQIESEFGSGWQLDVTLPVATLESALAGKWTVDAKLPILTMDAEFYPTNEWSVDVELPIAALDSYFYTVDLTNVAALSVNPRVKAHASYTNFSFAGFCRFNGEHLGIDETGIYRLEGDDDAGTPVTSVATFGLVDEGSVEMKRVDSVYANLRHDGEIRVSVRYDEELEHVVELDYDASIDPAGIHTRRAKFSRGAKGRNLQVKVENVSGSDFEITDLEMVTVPLSRS